MLREVFRTVPLTYDTVQRVGAFGAIVYNDFPAPYTESAAQYGVNLLIPTRDPTPEIRDASGKVIQEAGDTSLMLMVWMQIELWPGWHIAGMRYNGTNGKLIHRMDAGGGVALGLRYGITSRSGKYWGSSLASTTTVRPFTFGKWITAPVDKDGKPVDDEGKPLPVDNFFDWAPESEAVPYTHFEGLTSISPPFAIDDKALDGGRYLQGANIGSQPALGIWTWTTGKVRYKIHLPATVRAICLESESHVYVLLANRTLVLVDYIRGDVLGAAKVPALDTGNPYGSNSGLNMVFDSVRMSWDDVHRRILIMETTPDNPDGSSTMLVRGYRAVPEPQRITVPIPLKAPRQRRVIPVLVQVVDDMNAGVGGYAIEAQVTGSGSLVGVPLSDHMGNTLLQVACEGSPLFTGSDDWETTGSPDTDPSHTGLVHIVANATVYQPDPEDIITSGAPGGADGTPGAPGTTGFIWAWTDKTPTAPPPDAPGDQAGAPMTMAEWETYFFGLIKKTKGSAANDYVAVLGKLRDQGMVVNPPPDTEPQVAWPFYGIALIMAEGAAIGRIWLPTATPYTDGGHKWWTHDIQVIGTAPPTGAGGGSGSYGPSEMPNMQYLLQQAYDSKPAGYWKLNKGDAYDQQQPDGRGALTALAVQMMHDVDARFGHLNKTPPHNGYRPSGGSVDAVCFKNADGVSQEGADIISGSGGLGWSPYGRGPRIAPGDYNCWMYAGSY